MSKEIDEVPDFIKEKQELVFLTPLEKLPPSHHDASLVEVSTCSGSGPYGSYSNVRVFKEDELDACRYNRLIAYIVVGKSTGPYKLGTNEGILEVVEDAAPEEIVSSFCTPDSLFIVLSPIIYYSGSIDSEECKKAQEMALTMVRDTAATAITDYLAKQTVENQ